MTRFVDRGGLLNGQDRTSRDNRVPFNFPRSIENFSLPDKRVRRRVGYGSVHEHVRTQALAKHTGVTIGKRNQESDHNKGTFLITPLSYGKIKWQSEYQLRTTESTTIEFSFRMGEDNGLQTQFGRVAHYDTSKPPVPATGWTNYDLRQGGVLLLDQTIISNNHRFDDAIIQKNGTTSAGAGPWDLHAYMVATSDNFDVFPLTAMAIGYSNLIIFFEFGMVDDSVSPGIYYKTEGLSYTLPSYNEGDIYHVAVVHDHDAGANGEIYLYVNGTLRDTFILQSGYKFVGEWDQINRVVHASGQKRDIVLLNECTARASYASACKPNSFNHGNQTFHHGFGHAAGTVGLVPWCQSPSRGTAMWDLRIWKEARTAAEVDAWKNKRLPLSTATEEAGLHGNWHLNDGGPVCKNTVSGKERNYCTIHHGYPGYVNESDMLKGLGLHLSDGQHLIRSFSDTDRDLGVGVASKLGNVFFHEAGLATTMRHQEKHDFTVQIQIMVPDAFQAELNDDNSAFYTPTKISYDVGGVETRRPTYDGFQHLYDGTADLPGTSQRTLIQYLSGTNPNGCHMAYDQTLWSIEGTQVKAAIPSIPNEADRRRIPVARGLLTPDGKVAFELFKQGATNPRCMRLLSATTLSVGKVYTITFVQRAKYAYTTTGTHELNAAGWFMEIWIENVTDGVKPTVADSSYETVNETTDPYTTSIVHQHNYDVIIGASYVNDGWDWSINATNPGGAGSPFYHSYHPTHANRRQRHTPWPVQQHFMTPYQDQPGNFTLGFFRLWSTAVPGGDIPKYGDASLEAHEHTADLLFNLELEEITATEVPSKCRYPDFIRMGYKSWGEPQGYAYLHWSYTLATRAVDLPKKWYDSPWAFEDCLGYAKIDSEDYDADQTYATVRGILPMKSSVAKQYGVIGVYDDSLAFDPTVDGTYDLLNITNHGLVTEFAPGRDKYGTIVGNRTIITGPASLPKVFDGRLCTVAGFKRWSGGTPMVYPHTDGSGALTRDRWYGIAVVYWSESRGIYQVSPVVTVRLDNTVGDNAISLFNVPQHPDARVSIREVYRTVGQTTEDLAKSAPLYKTRVRAPVFGVSNAPVERLIIYEADSVLQAVVLDRFVAEMPACAYSASMNERLYLAGDPVNVDTVYFTDPGNPERIDPVFNSIDIPEGSGDEVVGMLAAFGAVFVFKPNAIWRLDDVGGNQHQFTRVSGVGPVSPKSIELIVDPDTGRTFIFFWSQHGPYLSDGQGTQYIGTAIEESTVDGSSAAQYAWLDPSTLVVAHNAVAREIMCIFSPKITVNDVVTTISRNCRAVVYNYRSRSWYTFYGLPGSYALSLSYNTAAVSADPNALDTVNYILLLGSINGKIFSWGTDDQDAVPNGFTPVTDAQVTDNDAGTLGAGQFKITGLTPASSFDLLDCWLTLVNTTTGDWVSAPITKQDNTTSIVTVDTTFYTGQLFDPDTIAAANLKAYICQPPAMVEFPWDELDVPHFDKDVKMLVTWHDTAFKYKLLHNYNDVTVVKAWSPLVDADSQRKRTTITVGKCEAMKLFLMSFDLKASLDAYGYLVQDMRGAKTAQ